MKFLQLDIFPRGADIGLLALRVWLGLSMAGLHGLDKAQNFEAKMNGFKSMIGLGAKPEFMLVVFAELVCSLLLVLGLFTRVSALFLIVTMAVAFGMVHGGKLSGDGNGELAFIYLGGFVALFFAGAGAFSVDSKLGGGRR